ncbi:MAG: alpha/beta hydrolase [Thermodesulfobacteriota bacterium]
MTVLLITFLGLIFVLAALYWFPLPGKSFHQLYANVDDGQRSALQAFRLENQLKCIHVKGSKWNYLSTGVGGRTIVFLHGMGGGFDIWFQQIDHFKTSYRIISMTYPPVSSLAELSEGVMAILDREKIDRTHIVGSSLGGYVAQYLVKSHPGRIEKAVFANTFPPNRIHAEKAGKMKFILPLLPEWMVMRNLRKTTAKAIYPASGHSELVRAYMLEQSHGMMEKAQFVGRFRCVLDCFEPPNLDRLNIPALIIEADNDPLVEKDLREMLKTTYPSAPIETFRQMGHFPYLNAPEDYNRILEQFIRNR